MKDQDCSAWATGCTEQKCEDLAAYFVAFGVGEPLFDTSAVVAAGTPDLWITLNDKSSKLGVWTPYSKPTQSTPLRNNRRGERDRVSDSVGA